MSVTRNKSFFFEVCSSLTADLSVMMKNEHTKIFFNKFQFPQFKAVEC